MMRGHQRGGHPINTLYLIFAIALFLFVIHILDTNFFVKSPVAFLSDVFDNSSFTVDEFKQRIKLLPEDNLDQHLIRPLPVSQWKQQVFQPRGSHSFIQFSAYRLNPSSILILGLGDSIFRNNHTIGPCIWHSNNGSIIQGKIFYLYDGERPYQYAIKLLRCNLDSATENKGGFLTTEIDGQVDVVFNENPNMIQGKSDDENFEFNHTYCTAPLHGHLHAKMMWQWMEYHSKLFDADCFVIYNVNYNMSEFMPYIQSYVERGNAEVVDFSDILAFNIWYFGQTLAAWDCTYRYALRSKWIYLHDMDEYLQVFPPHSLQSILKKHNDASWISHGMINWNVEACIQRSPSFSVNSRVKNGKVVVDSDEEFAVERMVFKATQIYCDNQDFVPPMCLYWQGHRKLIINPRKVTWAQVHVAVIYEGEGVDLNAETVMIHNHYRGIHSFDSKSFCSQLHGKNVKHVKGEKDWERNNTMANLGRAARSCLKNPSKCHR